MLFVKKFYFTATSGEKRAKFGAFQWNDYVFTKPNCKKLLSLNNQLKKKKKYFGTSWKKLKIFLVFEELITKIRDEFKQILHTSENQKRMWILLIFDETISYLRSQMQKIAKFKISTARKFYISVTSGGKKN